MGYSTYFNGSWDVDPILAPDHLAYLNQFVAIRHVRRDPVKAELLPDPLRLAVGLPIGHEGAYYVGTANRYESQNGDPSVINGNEPPGSISYHSTLDWQTHTQLNAHGQVLGLTVPGLWCGWVPDEGGTSIAHDEGEKFYDYVEWIQYLLDHFLVPWGYALNGDVYWTGEESDDRGLIQIVNNVLTEKHAHTTYR